jgi:coenzyme F420-reducing hydrogenase delta subunit
VVLQIGICGCWQKGISSVILEGTSKENVPSTTGGICLNETGCILKKKIPFFVVKMNRVQVARHSCRRNSTRQTARHLMDHE